MAVLEATSDKGTKATAAPEHVLENAPRPADKLKAAELVLHLLGFDAYRTGCIGGESGRPFPQEVVAEEAEAKHFKAMMASLTS